MSLTFRSPRRSISAMVIALAAAITGALAGAPSATAHSTGQTDPAPSAPTARAASEVGTGGVRILKQDPEGALLAGAAFTLADATGKETAHGTTNAEGQLAFVDLAAGIYRLREISSGSPIHDVVADQDVIVTPRADAPLTITDPFKPAQVVLRAKDDRTGRLLPGSTVNIGIGNEVLLTLTTGPKGTAAAKLPVASRKSEFWVKQVKAPEGYDLYKPAKIFTAGLGAPVTVTVTNAKTAVAPKPTPSRRPTHQPTNRPLTPTGMPTEITSGHPKPDALTAGTRSALSPTAAGSGFVSADAPTGALAQTGAGVTPWVLGGAGLLLAGGIGVVVAARRRALSVSGKEATGETN